MISTGQDRPALRDRLTVVLLTYNCAGRVGAIVERLLDLGVPIVAVDNASFDGTADVLSTFGELDVLRLPRNIGAAARNAGAERASTPYVAFCDDDGWWEREGLQIACSLARRPPAAGTCQCPHPRPGRAASGPDLGRDGSESSPRPRRPAGVGSAQFHGRRSVVRLAAYWAAGGYDERFFMGGEEETLAYPLAKLGWQMRYVPDVVMHHYPSLANATTLRAYGMRNTLVNAWLHRPLRSALRWTGFTLADTPKNRDWVRGMALTLRAAGWILRERSPMQATLDADATLLDARRYGPVDRCSTPRRGGRDASRASGVVRRQANES